MSRKNCLVSVCIPARNAEKFIRHTLNNLLKSDFDPNAYEILICNHGSADRTGEIISFYQKKYGNIKMIDIPFNGPDRPRARNTLLANASGEILIYIDQDILVSRQFIRSHVKMHDKYTKALVGGYTYGKNSMTDLLENDRTVLGTLDLDDITQSYDILKSKPFLKDARETLGYIKFPDKPFSDLTNTIAPFRAFWLCNFSFRKSELLKIGGFDGFYTEWGLDDDDTAYGLELSGNSMIFSNEAWAYHISHPVNVKNNVISWRKNCDNCLYKYKTRALELYSIYKGKIDAGVEDLELVLNLMPTDDEYALIIKKIAARKKDKAGKTLGIFIRDEKSAGLLNLSACLNPYLPINTVPYRKNGCRFFSLLGLHTCFDNDEFADIIASVDLIMFLDDSMLKMLMIELSRIALNVTFYFGKFTKMPENKYLIDKFINILYHINFSSVQKIELA